MIFSVLGVIHTKSLKGLIFLLGVLIFVLFSFSSNAGDKVNKTLTTENTTKIKICNDRGAVKVYSWDKNEVLVKGEIDDLADGFIFDKQDDEILIEVELSAVHAHGQNNGKGSKFEIWLPKTHDLQFNGVATDIQLDGLEGDVKINSVSGDILANKLSGKLKLKNISGKTELTSLSGNIDAAVVSGNLNANVSSKQIKVKGVSSDISVVTNNIEKVDLFSVSGHTKLSGSLADDVDMTLENISGESYFFYKDEIDAKVTISTGPDGAIVNRVKSIEKEDSHLNTQQQVFVEGLGMGSITMQTVDGKVGLRNYSELKNRK